MATTRCGYRLVIRDAALARAESHEEHNRWLESKGMRMPDGCLICSAPPDRFRWERDRYRKWTVLICCPEAHREFYDAFGHRQPNR